MANLITLSRLLLLILVVVIAYQPPSAFQFINVPLLILVFVTDRLDGYIAHKRQEATLFGAMFDIAGDRVVELTMWIVLSDIGLVPIWVPLIVVVRGVFVDTIRAYQVSSHRKTPFSMIKSPFGKWLVAGRFMRFFYALLKATAFCWLLLLQPMPVVMPDLWTENGPLLGLIGAILVYFSVAICLLRGLPVIIEFAYSERQAIFGVKMRNGAGREYETTNEQ